MLGHFGDLVGVWGVVGIAAVAQDIGPDRAVGHMDADIDGPLLELEGVEIFGEPLPLPVNALGQGGSPGMSSTPSISSMRKLWSWGRTGAKPTPQLPMMAVVTPCQLEGARSGSQVAWPS